MKSEARGGDAGDASTLAMATSVKVTGRREYSTAILRHTYQRVKDPHMQHRGPRLQEDTIEDMVMVGALTVAVVKRSVDADATGCEPGGQSDLKPSACEAVLFTHAHRVYAHAHTTCWQQCSVLHQLHTGVERDGHGRELDLLF